MSDLILNAPAKLNLSLKILRKREDGFHELETVMAPISGLVDTLSFTRAESFSFSCDLDGVPTDEKNLVVMAVRAFERELGEQVKVKIKLEKRVPHGAGLGGGSSDAASTLLGLNEMYENRIPFSKLHDLATELGSDVPFFLYGSPCLCMGKGEQIKELSPVAPFPVLLLKPAFGVPTPEAYKKWGESKEVAGFSYKAQSGPYGEMVNHLERPVFEKYLFLGELKKWLLSQPEVSIAQMSGSGSTMIALLNNLEDADVLINRAKEAWDPNLFSWAGMV